MPKRATSFLENSIHGLNLTVPEDARELVKPWSERESTVKFVDSGVDDQIILHIPFTQNVRVRSILLKLGNRISILSVPLLNSTT